MDFAGQKQAEQLCFYIILAAAIISFGVGWFDASFALMMKIYGSGVALAMVACVPDWPWFNRNPQKWQSPQLGAGIKRPSNTKRATAAIS